MKVIVLAKVRHFGPPLHRLQQLRNSGWIMVHGVDPASYDRIRDVVFSDVIWQREQIECVNADEHDNIVRLHDYLRTMLREPPMIWIEI